MASSSGSPFINQRKENLEAVGFCAWLSKIEQRIYRLPSDHEWSCAVGIGDKEDPKAIPQKKDCKIKGVYPWGTQWPPPNKVANLGDAALKRRFPELSDDAIEGYEDGFPTTSPVVSFESNELGLYDMGGNVRQWVLDWYNSGLTSRVLRGGG